MLVVLLFVQPESRVIKGFGNSTKDPAKTPCPKVSREAAGYIYTVTCACSSAHGQHLTSPFSDVSRTKGRDPNNSKDLCAV